MARHDGEFRADEQRPLSLSELLEILGGVAEAEGWSREEAIACYLSGGDGWREAARLLGGTFAEGAAELRELKDH
ncbi:MAG TPA: hypothetical protein VJT70_03290 [Sphingomicrobium sp.]|nr:hypothetical protein [Sphingomicrobium sp.]